MAAAATVSREWYNFSWFRYRPVWRKLGGLSGHVGKPVTLRGTAAIWMHKEPRRKSSRQKPSRVIAGLPLEASYTYRPVHDVHSCQSEGMNLLWYREIKIHSTILYASKFNILFCYNKLAGLPKDLWHGILFLNSSCYKCNNIPLPRRFPRCSSKLFNLSHRILKGINFKG